MASVHVLPVPIESTFEKRLLPVAQSEGHFAFARIQGELHLVQVSDATPASALTTVDVKLFRHEFITIFRFAGCRTLHPADINIIEPIETNLTRYEEDNGTVFLARDVMDRMRKLTDPRRNLGMGMIPGRVWKDARQPQYRLKTVHRHHQR
ncbi:hypothetical protein CPB83DRAFT_768458 [Crepidotus variabilis]|uniref:Uncharacterized protein n=1 Tax=Crepidotus variabilis TaxID=179855 RepID=A0A9P6JP55_9AGAR|nr:hypothetical protein CPB83DRAFT_768458 [Crepidotus variabilis]